MTNYSSFTIRRNETFRQKATIRRTVTAALSFLLFSVSLQAKIVTTEKALQVATGFFHNSVSTRSASLQLHEVMNSQDIEDTAAKVRSVESPTFYVFAPEQGNGFVIVAGDDISAPILAYSFEDAAPTAGNLPCNLLSWMEAMSGQISKMREDDTAATASVKQQWESTRAGNTVVLLETAKWSQHTPYNLQCPMDGNNQCITGCVSTAAAIVMRYFQWPEKGIGETEGYYTETNNIWVEARNLEHSYDWDNMPLENIFNNYTDAQAYAVSTLMADIGACHKADYLTTETSSYLSLSVLYKNFSYSSGMIWEYADNYEQDEWNDMLREAISTTGPVLYDGDNDTSGHMFVLDGYTDDGYFHINWGWGGITDGFFLLPSIEYAYQQTANFNVKPDDGSAVGNTLRMLSPGMSLAVDEVSRNVYFNIAEAYAKNISPTDWSGYVCFALTDSEGNIKEWISKEKHYTSSLTYNHYYSYYDVLCLITVDIEDGDRIRMFYKDSEVGEWKLMSPQTSDAVWEIVIGTDVAKAEDGPEEVENILRMRNPGMSLDVNEVSRNVYFNIAEAYATNISFTDWTGYVCFALTDIEGNIKEWISKEKHSSNALTTGYYRTYNNVLCLITVDFENGDRIRMFYKDSEEGEWKLMSPQSDDAVWEIVIGVDVAKGEDGPETVGNILQMLSPGMSLDTDVIKRDVSFHIVKAFALNVSFTDWNGSVCFALTDSDGNIKELISSERSSTSSLPYNYYFSYFHIPCVITVDFEDGDRIRMLYKDSEEGEWKVMYPNTDDTVWEIVIGEDGSSIETITMPESNDRETLYDLSGRRVTTPQKGNIYISRGKKILY